MNRFYLLLLLPLALLLLAGCESGGKLRMVNNTSYPIYVRVADGNEITMTAGSSHTFSISTAKQHIFNPDVEREVVVYAKGETFQLMELVGSVLLPRDSTIVVIKAGETLNAPMAPNRASFKVVNNSSRVVTSAMLFRHNFVAGSPAGNLGRIEGGQSRYLSTTYAKEVNSPNGYDFYYYAELMFEDDPNLYTYENNANHMLKDEQFLITITDPDK